MDTDYGSTHWKLWLINIADEKKGPIKMIKCTCRMYVKIVFQYFVAKSIWSQVFSRIKLAKIRESFPGLSLKRGGCEFN